jgi:1,5-anhydro-D-fructose reductase (1,5-anhydro-D-mannitol-forming)
VEIRWGVVGLGSHASERMLPALARSRYGRLAGVYSRRPERTEAIGRSYGARAYPAFDAMLEDPDVHAVYLATPNDLHRDQTIRAAAAGKHVLVEKPMALSVEDAAAMVRACADARVRLYVGFHLRFHPAHRQARSLVAAGEIGEIIWAGARWTSQRPADQGWRLDPVRAGGTLLTARGVHLVDLIRFVCGTEFRTVSGCSDGLRADAPVDNTTTATGELASGGFAHCVCSRLVTGSSNDLEICGTRGTIVCRSTIAVDPAGTMVLRKDGSERALSFDRCDLSAEQIDWVSGAIAGRDGEAVGADGQAGGRVTAVTVGVIESVQSAKTVALDYPF